LTLKNLHLLDQEDSDIKADFTVLSKALLSKIDPSIRKKLLKRGISVIKNIYTGFDTEYVNLNMKFNKMLSVQLAVNTKIYLRVPKYSEYDFSTIDTLKGKEYKIHYNFDDEEFNYNFMVRSLNDRINSIRGLNFKTNDLAIRFLINALKDLNIQFIEKDDDFIFSFPRSLTQPFIYYNDKDKGYSLKDVTNQSNIIGESQLNKDFGQIKNLLKNIFNKKPSDFNGAEITSKLILDRIESTKLPTNFETKRLSRSYMSSFTGDRVSVTTIRNNFLIAHLTNADLSMLNDFESFKSKLHIVNKSFVTLDKKLEISDTNVIIRDTKLLAPQANKNLESIGVLHKIPKIKISKKLKENMDVLLKQDKNLFEKYALNDAIITLTHANFMEDHYFKLKEIGVPITLNNLGSKYVKES